MIFAIKFKKCIIGINILGIIVSKLSYWLKLCPIIFLKINKSSKIDFDYIILFLGLAIYLKKKGN